jgi:hypothetical protein
MRSVLALWTLVLVLLAHNAHAGCCNVAKVDPETPVVPVRVCEPDAEGGCASELFVGSIELGEVVPICAAGDTVVYQEWDVELADFASLVEAVCDGRDVEL